MRIIRKLIGFGLLVSALVWFGGVLTDRTSLGEDLIRLHVVANSNSDSDQAVKLQVLDNSSPSWRSCRMPKRRRLI